MIPAAIFSGVSFVQLDYITSLLSIRVHPCRSVVNLGF